MILRKREVLAALRVVLPVEIVNFFVFMPPLDVGIAADASWFTRLLFHQWAVLHYPGLSLTSLVDPFYKAFPVDVLLWILSGYVDTALLIFLGILAFQWVQRVMRPRTTEEI